MIIGTNRESKQGEHRVARSASEALAAVTLPHALALADQGPRQALLASRPLRRGLTCLDGHMVRQVAAEWYGCPHLTDEQVVARLDETT